MSVYGWIANFTLCIIMMRIERKINIKSISNIYKYTHIIHNIHHNKYREQVSEKINVHKNANTHKFNAKTVNALLLC